VGFRPFVWQLAQQLGLRGDVCNDGDGVLVRLVGDDAPFLAALTRRCPPLARIDSAEAAPFVWAAPPRDLPSAKAGPEACARRLCPMPPPARHAWRR
jgi:hydrogenase maturation protein HypF